MSSDKKVNKPVVSVAGYIGQDPKMGQTSDGTPVCSFSIAHVKRTDDETLWIEVSVFGDPEAHAAFAKAEKGGFARCEGFHSTNEGSNGKTYDKLNAKIVMFGGVYVADYSDVPARPPQKAASKTAPKQQKAPPPDDPFNDDEIPF